MKTLAILTPNEIKIYNELYTERVQNNSRIIELNKEIKKMKDEVDRLRHRNLQIKVTMNNCEK